MTSATHLQPVVQPGSIAGFYTWRPEAWGLRSLATVLSLGISGAYAVWGFTFFDFTGASVLLAAGLAWPMLLAGTWWLSPRPWRQARIDWCFWTMAVGSTTMVLGMTAFLVLAAKYTTLSSYPWIALAGGLFLADVVMGLVFTRHAPSLHVRRRTALLIWIGGMNGFLFGAVALAAWLERIV